MYRSWLHFNRFDGSHLPVDKWRKKLAKKLTKVSQLKLKLGVGGEDGIVGKVVYNQKMLKKHLRSTNLAAGIGNIIPSRSWKVGNLDHLKKLTEALPGFPNRIARWISGIP